MGVGKHIAFGVLVLAACKLDTSGVDGEGSSGSDTSSGTAPTSGATTTATTTAPTTTAGEGTTAPTGTEASAGTETNTTESESATDDSTGDPDLGPFDDPVPIAELNSGDVEDDPTLRSDMLEIYFARTMGPPNNEDIYRATRDAVDEPFGEPELVDTLSLEGSADASPELSSDGLWISFSGAWPGGPGGNDVMIAFRDDWDAQWSEPERIEELTSNTDDAALAVTENALVGYFCRDLLGAPYWELMRTARNSTDDPWEEPLPLDSINEDGRDCAPWIDAGETELWFASVRPGGAGAEDIWRVAVTDGTFAAPIPVEELNHLGADEDPWLSPDGRTVVFASNRDGSFDLWMATR